MRYEITGDISRIKTAVFYKRSKVGLDKYPYKFEISVRSESTELNPFMEYNFKFKVDKGILSNFNIHNMMGDYLNSLLTSVDSDKDMIVESDYLNNLPDGVIVYQLDKNDSITRSYSYFKALQFDDFTEYALDVDPEVQLIEFYSDIISDISGFKNYDPDRYDPVTDLIPALIIKFGPEISYEPEDYVTPSEEMPIKPDNWTQEDKDKYIKELDEYSNRKFIFITRESEGKIDKVNLSLHSHTLGADNYHSDSYHHRYDLNRDPHRLQEDSILRNDEMKIVLSEDSLVEHYITEESNLVFDKRSNTLLGTYEDDKSKYILLNDYSRRIESNSNGYNEFSSYVEYNYGDIVYYLDREFKSLVDGNLGQNPFISPLWSDLSTPSITPGIPDYGMWDDFTGGGTDPDGGSGDEGEVEPDPGEDPTNVYVFNIEGINVDNITEKRKDHTKFQNSFKIVSTKNGYSIEFDIVKIGDWVNVSSSKDIVSYGAEENTEELRRYATIMLVQRESNKKITINTSQGGIGSTEGGEEIDPGEDPKNEYIFTDSYGKTSLIIEDYKDSYSPIDSSIGIISTKNKESIDYDISLDSSWLTVSKDSSRLKFLADENTTRSRRYSNILLKQKESGNIITITISQGPNTNTEVDPENPPTPVKTWYVNITSEGGGATSPIGKYRVKDGENLTVRFIPDNNFLVGSVLVNDQETDITGDNIVLKNITSNINVHVIFVRKLVNLTLSSSPSSGGNITGSSSGSKPYKSRISLTANPSSNYEFDYWSVNGELYSTDISITYELNDDTEIIAFFVTKQISISTSCSTGGYIDPDGSVLVNSGDNFILYMNPYDGYVVSYIEVNGIKKKLDENSTKYEVTNVTSPYRLRVVFGRPGESVLDPELGQFDYMIIGDLYWTKENLTSENLGEIYEGTSGQFGNLFLGKELKDIQKILDKGGTGFRIPTIEDWKKLSREVGGDSSAGDLKSPRIYSGVDLDGWKSSNTPGLGSYRFNVLPGGCYDKPGETKSYSGINTDAYFWSSTYDSSTESNETVRFTYNSGSIIYNKDKIDTRGLSVRLVKDAVTVKILGSDYIVKRFGNYEWTLRNLSYPDLGEYYEEVNDNNYLLQYGTLHSFEDILSISNLLSQESHGFRIPSDDDWKELEKSLGMTSKSDLNATGGTRGTDEGKRLKKDDGVYSGIEWKGYPTSSEENTGFRAVPSGYKSSEGYFAGLGLQAKFWSTSLTEGGTYSAMIRMLKNSSSKIYRQIEMVDNKCSIRLVREYKK